MDEEISNAESAESAEGRTDNSIIYAVVSLIEPLYQSPYIPISAFSAVSAFKKFSFKFLPT